MQITDYIKPELLAVALVLYFVGIGLKHSQTMQNQYVPGVLGILGILLAGLYVFATTEFQRRQEIAMAVFTAVVQGILVAGLSTYVDQLLGQRHKSCEKEEKEE